MKRLPFTGVPRHWHGASGGNKGATAHAGRHNLGLTFSVTSLVYELEAQLSGDSGIFAFTLKVKWGNSRRKQILNTNIVLREFRSYLYYLCQHEEPQDLYPVLLELLHKSNPLLITF